MSWGWKLLGGIAVSLGVTTAFYALADSRNSWNKAGPSLTEPIGGRQAGLDVFKKNYSDPSLGDPTLPRDVAGMLVGQDFGKDFVHGLASTFTNNFMNDVSEVISSDPSKPDIGTEAYLGVLLEGMNLMHNGEGAQLLQHASELYYSPRDKDPNVPADEKITDSAEYAGLYNRISEVPEPVRTAKTEKDVFINYLAWLADKKGYPVSDLRIIAGAMDNYTDKTQRNGWVGVNVVEEFDHKVASSTGMLTPRHGYVDFKTDIDRLRLGMPVDDRRRVLSSADSLRRRI
jgi:hypothetical protein